MIGKSISHYRIVDKLGEGGMGEVYLAEDTRLGRMVALKFLPADYADDDEFRTRFKREARAAAALNHPNIVTIHEVSEYNGIPFIAMEYVQGHSLKEVIAGADLSLEKVMDLAIQMTQGIAAAHAAGVIHRDVKPQNVIVDSQGRVRILDFGLAVLKADSMITRTDSTYGTVAYMSPEQTQKADVDHRSDIFSVGIVLYEMITRRPPFRGDHHAAIMYSIVNETPEPLARYKAGVPDTLQRIVEKALRKEPETRYQSADDMLADLKELQRETTSTQVSRAAGAPGERRSRAGLIAGVFVTVAIILVAAQFFLDRFMTDDTTALVPPAGGSWKGSVAVLPFRDFSPEGDQEYFCHGMTDAIINKLASIKDLKIISLSSAMRYKDTDRNLRTIGRELGVSTILEGSIQKEEDRIRLSAQLINVADDAHLWSATYDRRLESVFAIQDEISQAIVDVLKLRLLGDEGAYFAKRYTDNLDAYNAYAQGRFLWNKRTEQHLMKSIEYFDRAIELDPNYALAYAALADAWGVLPSNIGYPLDDAVAKAKEAARKAIEIDDELAEAHASLGLAFMVEEDYESAEPEFLRAIELNPGYAYAHYWYSMTLDNQARHDEALAELEAAYELDPLSVVILNYLAGKRGASADFDEAMELYERALEIEPTRMATYENAAAVCLEMEEPERAVDVYRRAMEVDTTFKQGQIRIAYTYGHMGRYDEAIEAALRAVVQMPLEPNAYDTLGEIYAMAGDLESAIESFEKAVELEPSFDGSLMKLAACRVWAGDYPGARQSYDLLAKTEILHTEPGAYTGEWFIPLYQGKIGEALKLVGERPSREAAAKADPMDAFNHSIVRILAYLELEEYDRVLDEISRVREMLDAVGSKDVTRMRDVEAVCLAASGEIAAAEDTLASWLGDIDLHNPYHDADYQKVRGLIELIKGDARAAIPYLERALTRASKPVFEAHLFLGEAYLEAGRPEEAVRVLEKILHRYDIRRASYPSWSVKVHYYMARAYEEAGRAQEAIEQYEKFLEIWADADRRISDVEDARERLRNLRAGQGQLQSSES